MSLAVFRSKRAVLMSLVMALALAHPAVAQECCSSPCTSECNTCNCFHCPPPLKHCTEGAPCIKFKCGCPKPVCTPDCSTPNWGYFQTCWRPWPNPVDFSHCPCGTPAAVTAPCGACTVPGLPGVHPGEPIPPPQPVGSNVRQSL